jgi:photosystem II stability/assembly factor-like uncharacterized protein
VPDLEVTALAINPLTPTTVYAGTDGCGLFKSMDGGGTWRAIHTGLNDQVISALAIDPSLPTTLYAGEENGGLFKSTDGGDTWSAANAGMHTDRLDALAIDPLTPKLFYAGAENNDWMNDLYISLDGGGHWATGNSRSPLAPRGVTSIAIVPQEPNVLYVGTSDDGIFFSIDTGQEWTRVDTALTDYSVNALAITSTWPNVLYAGTGTDGVFKSTDGGKSWHEINNGLVSP